MGQARTTSPGYDSEGAPAARIAVAVVTRDRPELFRDCVLPGLKRAAEAGYEVVVVDQSEGPETAELVRPVDGIRYLRSGFGLSVGRNAAIEATSSPLLAFTDDDVSIPPDWLESIAQAFESTADAGAVCGRAVMPSGEPLPGRPAGVYRWPSHPFRLGHGMNMSLRREALEAVGPFDEDFGPGARFRNADDTDLIYRLLRGGWSVVCRDDIVVVHDDWRSGDQERRLHFEYGFGAGAQTAKHVLAKDVGAIRVGARETAHHLRVLVWALSKRERRVATLQAPFLRGFARGFLARLRTRPTGDASSAHTGREAAR